MSPENLLLYAILFMTWVELAWNFYLVFRQVIIVVLRGNCSHSARSHLGPRSRHCRRCRELSNRKVKMRSSRTTIGTNIQRWNYTGRSSKSNVNANIEHWNYMRRTNADTNFQYRNYNM